VEEIEQGVEERRRDGRLWVDYSEISFSPLLPVTSLLAVTSLP
jgi:hypothetical protein